MVCLFVGCIPFASKIFTSSSVAGSTAIILKSKTALPIYKLFSLLAFQTEDGILTIVLRSKLDSEVPIIVCISKT